MGNVEIEIEEPGISTMGQIYRKSTMEGIVIELLVNHSFVPGTNDKVFNPSDRSYLDGKVKMKFKWVHEIFAKAKEWAGEEDPTKKLIDSLKKILPSITDTPFVNDSEVEKQDDQGK